MDGEHVLYEYLYESILTSIYSGGIRRGQQFPSQQELCRRYNVGITTVREVMRMLERDGFIDASPRKRATLLYDMESEAYVSVLLRRKAFILDLYQGLDPLLSDLHFGGAVRYRDFHALQTIIDSIRDDMDERTLNSVCSLFFLELLRPYRNQIICDLQSDSEQFTMVPYLALSGLDVRSSEDPPAARRVLQRLLELMRSGDRPALLEHLRAVYGGASARTRSYLEALERRFQATEAGFDCQWFMGKNRAHLYTTVARRLARRIRDGEFDGRRYLPSLPELMREYAVSQATALSAVALLNDVGIVHTYDKRGTVAAAPGDAPPPIRLDRAVIGENLVLALEALQFLAVCSGVLARTIFPVLGREAAAQTEKSLGRHAQPAAAIMALLDLFKTHSPSNSLKNIFVQLDDLLIWAHYLERLWQGGRPEADRQAARHTDRLAAALRARDAECFSASAQAIFRLSYTVSRDLMLSAGAAPDKLPAALDECGELMTAP